MGFVHGESYIITSAFDGAVIDVKRARTTDGSKVITYSWNGEPNQIWTVNSESGGFRLAASHVTDNIRVLDQGDGTNRIVLWKFHGGHNQLWNAFGVAHNPGVFFIQNNATGMCIRNMGVGQPLQCVAFNEHDPSAHWRLTPLSGPMDGHKNLLLLKKSRNRKI